MTEPTRRQRQVEPDARPAPGHPLRARQHPWRRHLRAHREGGRFRRFEHHPGLRHRDGHRRGHRTVLHGARRPLPGECQRLGLPAPGVRKALALNGGRPDDGRRRRRFGGGAGPGLRGLSEVVRLHSTLVGSVGLLVVLGAIAIKGIGESATTAALLTGLEVLGLLLVIWFGRNAFASVDVSTCWRSTRPSVSAGCSPARSWRSMPSSDSRTWSMWPRKPEPPPDHAAGHPVRPAGLDRSVPAGRRGLHDPGLPGRTRWQRSAAHAGCSSAAEPAMASS